MKKLWYGSFSYANTEYRAIGDSYRDVNVQLMHKYYELVKGYFPDDWENHKSWAEWKDYQEVDILEVELNQVFI